MGSICVGYVNRGDKESEVETCRMTSIWDSEKRKYKDNVMMDIGKTGCGGFRHICMYQDHVPWQYWNFELLLWTDRPQGAEPVLTSEEYKLWSSTLWGFLHSPVTCSILNPNILLSALFSEALRAYVLPSLWETTFIFLDSKLEDKTILDRVVAYIARVKSSLHFLFQVILIC
jgi:hypothetical protein